MKHKKYFLESISFCKEKEGAREKNIMQSISVKDKSHSLIFWKFLLLRLFLYFIVLWSLSIIQKRRFFRFEINGAKDYRQKWYKEWCVVYIWNIFKRNWKEFRSTTKFREIIGFFIWHINRSNFKQFKDTAIFTLIFHAFKTVCSL